jgi:hypothetical protein
VSYIPGQSKPVPVGRQLDIDIPRKYTKAETKVNVRVFWPQGARPTENGGKLPCFLHIRMFLFTHTVASTNHRVNQMEAAGFSGRRAQSCTSVRTFVFVPAVWLSPSTVSHTILLHIPKC